MNMETDASTLQDLSIIHQNDEQSILKRLDYCRSEGGRRKLNHLITHPHKTLEQIKGTEAILKLIRTQIHYWPEEITNGTIQMIDQFYAYPLGSVPKRSAISAYLYQVFNRNEYAMVRFSVHHFIDFLKGMRKITHLINQSKDVILLSHMKEDINKLLSPEPIRNILENENKPELSTIQLLKCGSFLYHKFRHSFQQLKEIYYRMDAWQSMALAMQKNNMQFPEWVDSELPEIEATELRHLLLNNPVGYQFKMNNTGNFMFLTGANMAGKSTFIKAVGTAVYLAHLGMGVPAKNMKLSLFEGIISNIQIQDNIMKGESYFFNEIQRIKNTLTKIKDGRKWLVLIDELFKGTNIQDAMLCSKTVIEGLVCAPKSIFILSTHLYEIGDDLKKHPNILFRYFETISSGNTFSFSYLLKDGISNDRFGYLILEKEKVTKLISEIKSTYNKNAP